MCSDIGVSKPPSNARDADFLGLHAAALGGSSSPTRVSTVSACFVSPFLILGLLFVSRKCLHTLVAAWLLAPFQIGVLTDSVVDLMTFSISYLWAKILKIVRPVFGYFIDHFFLPQARTILVWWAQQRRMKFWTVDHLSNSTPLRVSEDLQLLYPVPQQFMCSFLQRQHPTFVSPFQSPLLAALS